MQSENTTLRQTITMAAKIVSFTFATLTLAYLNIFLLNNRTMQEVLDQLLNRETIGVEEDGETKSELVSNLEV
jgi:type VI protein secretion system component VasA